MSVAAAARISSSVTRLRMPGPPAERVVHVHDDAARSAEVQAPHDRGHERAVDARQHDADALAAGSALSRSAG